MKLIFMGTPDFAVTILDELIQAGHEIGIVVTQPDRPKGRGKKLTAPPVADYAKENNLEFIQPESVKDEAVLNKLSAIQADAVIVAAYGRILGQQLLDMTKYGCLNVHASILPKYRGAAPIQWALRNGDAETGVSIMKLELGLDEGPVFSIDTLEIEKSWNKKDLFDALADLGGKLIVKTLYDIEYDNIQAVPQDSEKATYAPMFERNAAHIDFNSSAENLINLNRSLLPDDAIYTYLGEKRLSIKQAYWSDNSNESLHQPGEVVSVSKDVISISTKDGLLNVTEIQPAGKKSMSIKDFLNGNQIEIGTKFL